MPLDPLQEDVARVALHLAEAAHVALAGGGAMLAHEFVDRPTMDLDLFTSDPAEVGPVTDALHEALHERGYAVEVTRREDTFSHLQVTAPDGRQVEVDLAQDARMLPAVQLSIGAVLHPDELAADKTLALFGRGAARDLVDVDALAGRYGHDRLLELAAAKDPGFDVGVFGDALGYAAGRPAQAFAELGVDELAAAGLRERAVAWRDELMPAPDNSGPVPVAGADPVVVAADPVMTTDPVMTADPVAPNGLTAALTLDEENTVTRPASLEDVMAALDAQEAALSRMEERVGRLEAGAGGDVASVDVTRQHEVVQETDYEQTLHRERERLAEQDRELGR